MPSVVRYWYSTPTYGKTYNDPTIKDFRGFAQTWSQDDATGIVRHTTWEVGSAAFNGRPAVVEYGASTFADAPTPPAFTVFRAQKYWHATRAIASATACSGAGTTPGAPEVPPAHFPVIPHTAKEQDIRTVDGLTLTTERSVACGDVSSVGNVRATLVDPDVAAAGDEYVDVAFYEVGGNPSAACKDCVTLRARTIPGGALLEATKYTYTPTFQVETMSRQVTSTDGWTTGDWALLSTFTWESNGNLRSKVEGAVTTSFTYDPAYLLRLVKVKVSQPGTATLVSDTHYDGKGLPDLVKGPYIEGSTAGPALATAYDPFGRPRIVARGINGSAITDALAAFEYGDYPAASPAWVKAHGFSVAQSYTDPAIPAGSDVRQTTTWIDALGRDIQVRQRMGGSASGPASAAITQNLSQYRVAKAVLYDGAGRVKAALEPYYSRNAGYQDVSLSVDGSAWPVHATLPTYDGQGRVTCSVRRYVSSSLPAAGTCTSTFAENSSHALATLTRYRGVAVGSKVYLAVKTVPPENNYPGSALAGPESFFDAAGLLRRTVDVGGNESVVLYDRIGRQTGLQRIRSQAATTRTGQVTTSVTLDLMGRVTAQNDPNFGKRTIIYDPVSPGLVQKIIFTRTLDHVSYTYDKGRVATVRQCKGYAPDPCITDTLVYDSPYQPTGYDHTAGRLSWVANGATTIAVGYDQNGTMVRRDQWFAGVGQGFSTLATVRGDGLPVQTHLLAPGYPTFTQATSYDSLGRPAGLASGTTTHWSATNVAANTGGYDAAGRLLGAGVDAGRVQQAWTYGAGSALLSAQSVQIPGAANPLLYSVGSMTYRGTRLSGYTDQVNQTTYAFGYSDSGRLISAGATPAGAHPLAQSFATSLSYSVNKQFSEGASFGNMERVQEYRPATNTLVDTDRVYSGVDVETAPYAGPDAVTSFSTPLPGGPERFEYDLLNRLVSVTRPNASEKLWYDPLGGLVTRQLGNTVISYLGNGATVTGTLNAGCAAPACGVTIASVDAHLIAGAKRIGSVRLGAAPRTVYLHRDRLGSVVATTLAGGQAGASYRYSPYGATEVALGDAGNAASELGYAGALRLSGGLLLMGARVYHPGMKTFLQTDPLSPYAYRYTEGDPVNFADPSGMAEQDQQRPGGCTPQGGTCKTIPSLSDGSTMGWAITSDGGFVYWAPDDVGVSWSVTDDGVVHITFGNGDHWGSYRAFETRGGGLNGASDRVFGDRVARAPREGGDRRRADWGAIAAGVGLGVSKAGNVVLKSGSIAKAWGGVSLVKALSQTGVALVEWTEILQFSAGSEVLLPAVWADTLVPAAAAAGMVVGTTVLTHAMVGAANDAYSSIAPDIYVVLSRSRGY